MHPGCGIAHRGQLSSHSGLGRKDDPSGSRTLGAMSSSRPDGLPASKVLSHLGVMLVVSAVLGVVVSGLAIPFAGVLGFGARNVSESIDDLPQELEAEALPQRTSILDRSGNTIATVID